MRLIDADAFAEYLKDAVKQQKYENTKIDRLLTVADVIEAVISELEGTSLDGFKNAPTIEPERKKGRWVLATNFPYGDNCYVCINCKVKLDSMYPNFCPNCGDDMREGDA